ncbi:hypothetical protein Q8F55_002575 [Vanrija albida]|uniref:t-SNARE coiled-coil homology domain-containing protein n=1 Tax=Vanrija albida TaxID=181172 RepID=A0ABR3QA68_9TREE
MLAPVTALSLLSMDPSPAVRRSASAAAGTRHGLVNLTRLVGSLDKQALEQQQDGLDGVTWLEIQKTWETVLYARALLGALKGGNEQSSTTLSSLNKLEKTLSKVETHVQGVAKRTSAPAPATSLPYLELPTSLRPTGPPSPVALLDEAVATTLPEIEEGSLPPALSPSAPVTPAVELPSLSFTAPKAPAPPSLNRTVSSKSFSTETYFARREKEDKQGGEAGLLPLKTQATAKGPLDSEGMRKRLMGGATGTLGSAQLHEELGGQLVDMSHRLKLNAVHFANSLEEEKALLESSQGVLERNLETTKQSKGTLSKVSSKGRGTTCLTIGVVLLVIVLFVWTYLLIRFTP